MTVQVDASVPSDLYVITVVVTTASGQCSRPLYLEVYGLDLDGDADHDGQVDVGGADDDLEAALPGVITLCNLDDDDEDGNKDGLGPEAETVDNGGASPDSDDFAVLKLRAMPNLPQNWTVSLTLNTPSNVAPGVGAAEVVRVFAGAGGGPAVPILGPSQEAAYTLVEDAAGHNADLGALRGGDVTLWFEGLEFAGEVMLTAELLDDAGAMVCTDHVQLKVAPLILLHHLNDPVKSYVSQISQPAWLAADATEYCTDRFPSATPPAVIDEIIGPGPENGSIDPWAQDEFQIGFQDAPYKSMYVVLDSKRDRGLAPFPPSLLAPDFGHIQIQRPGVVPNTRDAFGNLEVTPPFTDRDGVEYPFGRVYYGFTDENKPDQMDPDLRAFLDRQEIQAPIALNTDWLWVGHVDEFMSIVPNPGATNGWSALWAMTPAATQILADGALVPGGIDPNMHIPRYRDHDIGAYVVDTIGALLDRPLSADPTLTIFDYNDASSAGSVYRTVLSDLEWDVILAFGLVTAQDMRYLPVLFDEHQPGYALAITPDLVNGASYGVSDYIAPEPFLCAYNAQVDEDANQNFWLDAGEDLNADGKLDTFRDPFRIWTDQEVPANIGVTYVDDWQVYHLHAGEVHCSSNEKRAIPGVYRWWD